MSQRIRFCFVALLLLCVSGCSYLCKFEVRGNIDDWKNRFAIPNVKVELVDADGKSLADTVLTDKNGTFKFDFQTSPNSKERKGWKLILSADGYEKETIEVGPVSEPKGGNETTYIVLRAFMRRTL